MPAMAASTTTLTASDGFTLEAHRAEPEGGAAAATGGVVVLQEIFGVNDHIRDVTDRFAEAGWLAIAPALFDRSEPGTELEYDQAGMEQGFGLAVGSDPDLVMLDVTAAVDAAAEAGPVAVVGFCWGGQLAARATIELAERADHPVAAAVGYYPSRAAQTLLDRTPAAPLLLHIGEQDQGIPASDIDAIEAAWPEVTVHRYAGAGHGFNCDRRQSYDPDAAALAWSRTLAFLDEHLAR